MATASALHTTTFDRMLPDRLLGWLALGMLAIVAVAVARGHADWSRVPLLVWAHLALIAVALALTPVMLVRRKGDRRHRQLGYVWAGAMLLTAATSLFVNTRLGSGSLGVFSGDFSPIHILSLFVLIQVPRLVLRARRHDVARHRAGVRGMVIGALLIAGFFTFPFDRMLGHWLFA